MKRVQAAEKSEKGADLEVQAVETIAPRDPQAEAPEKPKLMSLAKLAEACDHVVTLRGIDGRTARLPNAAHKAADALHGWSNYAYHYGREVLLTREVYLKAVEAAQRPSDGRKYVPHALALPPKAGG